MQFLDAYVEFHIEKSHFANSACVKILEYSNRLFSKFQKSGWLRGCEEFLITEKNTQVGKTRLVKLQISNRSFQQAKSESGFKLFRDVFRVQFLMRNELILSFSDWLANFWSSFKRVIWRQTCSPSAVIEEKERLCQRKRRLHHIDSCFTTMDQN